jgi:hypothetical protein
MTDFAACFSCVQQRRLSYEHIISKALGGRLKRKLYCAPCNNEFGRTIDADLSQKFGHVATTLNIHRESGSNQPFEVTDQETGLALVFDGKHLRRKRPIVKYQKTSDGKKFETIDVTAGSEKQLKQIRKGFRAADSLLNEGVTFQERRPGPIDTMFDIAIDGKLVRRAIAKIAYSLLCDRVPSAAVLSKPFDEIRKYMKGAGDRDLAAANYIHTDWTCDNYRPLHRVVVSTTRAAGLVVGYVTLFGMFRFTALLSNCFVGNLQWPPLDYAYDPVTRKVVECSMLEVPMLSENQILRPQQSRSLVTSKLLAGSKMIGTYVPGYQPLGIELQNSKSE